MHHHSLYLDFQSKALYDTESIYIRTGLRKLYFVFVLMQSPNWLFDKLVDLYTDK